MTGSGQEGDGRDGDTPDDSLELLGEQDRVLVHIFDGWDATTPPADADTRTVVRSNYERGTYGKLLIQHTAIRVAAKTDIARVLHDIGCDGLADDLTRHLPEARRLLDRLDELARGVEAMGVAASTGFAGTVGELAALIRADIQAEPDRMLPATPSRSATTGPGFAAPGGSTITPPPTWGARNAGTTTSRSWSASTPATTVSAASPGRTAALWPTPTSPSRLKTGHDSDGWPGVAPRWCGSSRDRAALPAAHRGRRRGSRCGRALADVAADHQHGRPHRLHVRRPPRNRSLPVQNAVIGHTVAVGAGLAALAVFGLVQHPSVTATGAPSFTQAAAAAVAAGVTVAVLEVVGCHHAPAAATALLIATGLAKAGAPLIGLVLGLAIVIALGPLIGQVPLGRRASTAEQTSTGDRIGRPAPNRNATTNT